MKIIIREYQDKDFIGVVSLMTELQEYFSEIDVLNGVKKFSSEEDAKLYINDTFKKVLEMEGVTYVAEIDNEIVGFIQGIVDHHKEDVMYNLSHIATVEGWIGLLFTNPKFRNMGVARSLLNKIKDYFIEKNCKVVKLYVSSENKSAINIYEKYGFKSTDLEMSLNLNDNKAKKYE